MDSMDLPDSSGEGDAATDAADGGVYASEAACPASFSGAPSAREISIGNAEGEKITKVPLVGAGSMTASFNSDQRLIWLDIAAKTASTVTVNIPFNDAVAPPGDHMVFVLRRNSRPGAPAIPSIGCWTKR